MSIQKFLANKKKRKWLRTVNKIKQLYLKRRGSKSTLIFRIVILLPCRKYNNYIVIYYILADDTPFTLRHFFLLPLHFCDVKEILKFTGSFSIGTNQNYFIVVVFFCSVVCIVLRSDLLKKSCSSVLTVVTEKGALFWQC